MFLIQRITVYRYTNVHCRPTAAFQQGNDIRSCFFVGNPDTYTEYDFALIRCIRIIYKNIKPYNSCRRTDSIRAARTLPLVCACTGSVRLRWDWAAVLAQLFTKAHARTRQIFMISVPAYLRRRPAGFHSFASYGTACTRPYWW